MMKLEDLPNEILMLIISILPTKTQFNLLLVSKLLNSIVHSTRINLRINLINTNTEPSGHYMIHPDYNLYQYLNLDSIEGLQVLKQEYRSFNLILFNCYSTRNKFIPKGFQKYTITNPGYKFNIDEAATSITLKSIHRDVNLRQLPNTITEIILETDGRFEGQENTFSYLQFDLGYISNLKHLILDGPWIDMMIDFYKPSIDFIKTITTLETLIIDLDQLLHGCELILGLLNALPNLKRFGRIGRVDKRFWRMVPKHQFKKIEWIQVGGIKYPVAHAKAYNPKFLQDLSFGLCWSFPNLKRIQIFMAFQGGNNQGNDHLLEICKDLKLGLPLEIVHISRKESITTYSDSHTLERIDIFQMSDVELLRSFVWTYAAKNHAGYPIKIYVTDDIIENGSIGRKFREF